MEIAGSYWETLLSFTIKLLVKGGGGENQLVGEYMIATNGVNRGSLIT